MPALVAPIFYEDVRKHLLERDEKDDPAECVQAEGTQARGPAQKRPGNAGPQDDAERDQHAGDRDAGPLAAADDLADARSGKQPLASPEPGNQGDLSQREERDRGQPATFAFTE